MEALVNKVILITGASTGIGGHTAKVLARLRPRLALVARSPDKLAQVKAHCEDQGCGQGNVLTVKADLGKQEDVSKVVSETVNRFGQLDVLVNNAAAFVFNDIENTSAEAFDRTMAVNVRAPFFLSQAAMPYLRKTKGSVINISSIAAQRTVADLSVYSISKAALEHFSRTLALEVAKDGIRVNTISVGGTLTDTQKEMSELMGNTDVSIIEQFRAIQPLGGFCSMDDIAKVVTFLASDLSAAMTGTTFPVDRGYLLVPPRGPEDLAKYMDQVKNMGDINPISVQDSLEQLKAMAAKGKDGDQK